MEFFLWLRFAARTGVLNNNNNKSYIKKKSTHIHSHRKKSNNKNHARQRGTQHLCLKEVRVGGGGGRAR